MKDLIVITGATKDHGTLPLYRYQLAEAGIDMHVEDMSGMPNMNGGGNLGWRVRCFRKLAQQFCDYQAIIFTDAFDVTFYGTKEEVIGKIPTDSILHGAEKNCYPDPSIADRIEKRTPWCFANGGVAAGTPENFLMWCRDAERNLRYSHNMLDQEFLNILLAEGSLLIDDRTELFYCLFCGYDELDFDNGHPINTLFETRPNFIHANGKWPADEAWAKRERSLQ